LLLRGKNVGIGMIGHGFMGRAHSMCFNRIAEVFGSAVPELVTIAGRDGEKVRAAATRHRYIQGTTQWEEMLDDPRIDVVVNTTPTCSHAALSIAALRAGKHTIVEKPFALNLAEAKDMVTAARESGQKGFKNLVAFNYRFVPALRLARQLISTGAIGEIYQYRSVYIGDRHTDRSSPYTWRMDVAQAGGGALTDLNSHAIDMLRFLTGQEVSSVLGWLKTFIAERADEQGTVHPVTIDEAAVILAQWDNGKVATLEASRVATGYKNSLRIEIHGSEGGIIFDLARGNELQFFSRKDPLAVQGFRTISATEPSAHDFLKYWWPRGHNLGWEHNHLHMLHHFLECVINEMPIEPWGATFEDGLRCQEIIEAVKISHATKCWVELATLR
jgi:predicted dehydrogenase